MRKRKPSTRSRDNREVNKKTSLTLAKRLLRAAPVLISLVLLVFAFSRLGVLDKFETVALDTEAHLNALPEKGSHVAIVDIDDDYYQKHFASQSPLNPEQLHDLINKIAACHPKVIGVDLVTTDSQFKERFRAEESCADRQPCNGRVCWPPIVWARDLERMPRSEGDKETPLPVLGGKGAEFDLQSGLALLWPEPESKVVRVYRRFVETADGPLPSFAWATVRQYELEKIKALDQFAGPLFIRYVPDLRYEDGHTGTPRFELTAGRLEELYEKSCKNDCDAPNPLKNEIVLLGGSYSAGRDIHQTPLGEMPGVRIHSNIIETELGGGGYRPPSPWATAMMESFGGVVLILLFHFLRPLKALLISMAIIAPLAFLCSFVSFASFSRWAFFAPVLVGILLYELFEHYRRTMIPDLYKQVSGATEQHEHHSE